MDKEVIKTYKMPLIFGIVGLAMLVLAVILSWFPHRGGNLGKGGIEIEEATVAGELKQRTILIDLEGAVEKPGVYEMEEETRVADLLDKAGGLSKKADLDWVGKNINRAQKLVDGAKIYIPFKGETIERKNDRTIDSKININIASASELESLSGVGEKTAEKIINGRPYSKIEELLEKKIVGSATFEKIKERISVF